MKRILLELVKQVALNTLAYSMNVHPLRFIEVNAMAAMFYFVFSVGLLTEVTLPKFFGWKRTYSNRNYWLKNIAILIVLVVSLLIV